MEHFISLSNHYHAMPPVDLSIARTEFRGLIDWLTHSFVKTHPQRPTPDAGYCCTPNKHCLRHGVNCPRFSPLTPV